MSTHPNKNIIYKKILDKPKKRKKEKKMSDCIRMCTVHLLYNLRCESHTKINRPKYLLKKYLSSTTHSFSIQSVLIRES